MCRWVADEGDPGRNWVGTDQWEEATSCHHQRLSHTPSISNIFIFECFFLQKMPKWRFSLWDRCWRSILQRKVGWVSSNPGDEKSHFLVFVFIMPILCILALMMFWSDENKDVWRSVGSILGVFSWFLAPNLSKARLLSSGCHLRTFLGCSQLLTEATRLGYKAPFRCLDW